MTPVRLPAGATPAPWVGLTSTAEEKLALCPVGQRMVGIQRYQRLHVEGLAPLCARFEPDWVRAPQGALAQGPGVTTGRALTSRCAADAWMTGIRVDVGAFGLGSAMPICRGRQAPAPGSDSEYRPGPLRSDCPNTAAIGLRVKAAPDRVEALSVLCAPG